MERGGRGNDELLQMVIVSFWGDRNGLKLVVWIVVVQPLSRVRLFAIPWTAACQASLFFTISWSLLKLISIYNLILCCSLLLLPSIFPSIKVFSNESALLTRQPKYRSFSISPSNECLGLLSFRINWFDLLAVQGTLSNTTVRKHQFFGVQPSLWSNSHIHTWLLEKNIALTISFEFRWILKYIFFLIWHHKQKVKYVQALFCSFILLCALRTLPFHLCMPLYLHLF